MTNFARYCKKMGTVLLICCLTLSLIQIEAAAASSPTESLERKIDAYIAEQSETKAGLAVIVLAKENAMIKRTVGYADIEKGIEVDADTVFEWGSCSKLLVWVSVMQLVEAGKIDLTADVRNYLPKDFKLPADKPITMLNLMNHNAGFEDFYTDLMVAAPYEPDSLSHALQQTRVTQVFQPGEIVAYSNYGSALAAHIVEAVSGIDYREYVWENIFTPLGMMRTSIDPVLNDNDWVKAQRSNIQGYTGDGTLMTPNWYVIPLYPSGSVVGTAADMALFLAALISDDGQPLFKNPQTIDALFEPTDHFPGTNIPRMAHGFFSIPAASQIYGHSGNTIAFSASLYFDREQRLGCLVLTNQAGDSTYCFGIPELVFGELTPTTNQTVLENSAIWTGIYRPARASFNGFSKLSGLFSSGVVKQHGEHDLINKGNTFLQQTPGIYLAAEGYSMFSRDTYSLHSSFGKVLSAPYGDLIPVTKGQHFFEIALTAAAGLALLASLINLVIVLMRKVLKKQRGKPLGVVQSLLNLLLGANILFMALKALALTSYAALKIHFVITLGYLIATFLMFAIALYRSRTSSAYRGRSLLMTITQVSALILCSNILYWELYH